MIRPAMDPWSIEFWPKSKRPKGSRPAHDFNHSQEKAKANVAFPPLLILISIGKAMVGRRFSLHKCSACFKFNCSFVCLGIHYEFDRYSSRAA